MILTVKDVHIDINDNNVGTRRMNRYKHAIKPEKEQLTTFVRVKNFNKNDVKSILKKLFDFLVIKAVPLLREATH